MLCMEWDDLLYREVRLTQEYASIDVRDFPDAERIFRKLYKLVGGNATKTNFLFDRIPEI